MKKGMQVFDSSATVGDIANWLRDHPEGSDGDFIFGMDGTHRPVLIISYGD